MASITQNNFSSGILSTGLHARADLRRYATGVADSKNMIPESEGPISSRPGFEYKGVTKKTSNVRMIPWVFSDVQAFILEVGDSYIRFIKAGDYIKEASKAITGMTQANPVELSVGAHGYATGNTVFIDGIVGVPEINNNYYVITSTGAGTFTLNGVDSTAYAAYTSGGTAEKIFEVATTYLSAIIFFLTYAQSADVMPIAHSDHKPAELKRIADTNWELADISFNPRTGIPWDGQADLADGTAPTKTITAATASNPVVLTVTGHGYKTGALIFIDNTITGMTEIGIRWFIIKVVSVNTFELQGENGSGHTAYIAGGKTRLEGPRYRVTGINAATGIESLIAFQKVDDATRAVNSFPTGITNANPAVVSITQHPFYDGQEVVFSEINSGMIELDGGVFTVRNITANTFELEGIDSTNFGVYAAVGNVYAVDITSSGAEPTTGDPILIRTSQQFNDELDQTIMNVYREEDGVYGFIGQARYGPAFFAYFFDNGITPNPARQPPDYFGNFIAVDERPAAVSYYQQRLLFAATNKEPEAIYGSQVGNLHRMDAQSPLGNNSALSLIIVGPKVNRIRHLVEAGIMVSHTEGMEAALFGDETKQLTPFARASSVQTTNGTSTVRPIGTDNEILYIQARGSKIRRIAFNFQKDGYTGADLTRFAPELFRGFTIVDWAYQEEPDSVVWIARSDGLLLSMTWKPEDDTFAMSQHPMVNGKVRSLAAIPEGEIDRVYAVIERTVNSVLIKTVERLASRLITNVAVDAYFVDGFRTYDGRNTAATTMTITTGTTYEAGVDLTLTADASFFIDPFVGDWIFARSGTDLVKLEIMSVTSPTVAVVHASSTVPTSLQAIATSVWGRATKKFFGLRHLIAETVNGLGDGDPLENVIVDSDGRALFDDAHEIMHVGELYNADVAMLDVEVLDAETLMNKQIVVNSVTMKIENSRGVTGSTSEDGTFEVMQPFGEVSANGPLPLETRNAPLQLRGKWDYGGSVYIRQPNALPMKILSITREGEVGGV